MLKKSIFAASLCLGLFACGDDSSSANDTAEVESSSSEVVEVSSSSAAPAVESSSSATVSSSSVAASSSSEATVESSSSETPIVSSSSLVAAVEEVIGKLGCDVTVEGSSVTQDAHYEDFSLVSVFTMVENGTQVEISAKAASCDAVKEVIEKYAMTDNGCVVTECVDNEQHYSCFFDIVYDSVEEIQDNLDCEFFNAEF